MKIHLLSDIHLECESYTLPADLDFDVLVAAGDISDNPKQAIDFLAAVSKPVVYVLGNHDYWSHDREHLVDLHDRLSEIRKLAEGTQVHLLEMESIVIDGVRFLGSTFWTNYANNAYLAAYAGRAMNDFWLIGSKHWLSHPGAKRQFERDCQELDLEPSQDGYFHPAIAFRWHKDAKHWLAAELRRKPEGWTRTVVVTHHQPSYHCLTRAHAIKDAALDRHNWHGRLDYRWDTDGIYRVAAYASDCDLLLSRHHAEIDLWCCGHVHAAVDTAAGGVRIVANPRGYYVHAADDFDPQLVIDLENQGGYMPALLPEIEESIDRLLPLLADVKSLAASVKHRKPAIRMAVRETINTRLRSFNDEGEKISARIAANVENDDGFSKGLNFAVVGFTAYVPSTLCWRPLSPKFPEPDVNEVIGQAEQFIAALHRIPELPALVSAEANRRAQLGIDAAQAAGFRVTVRPISPAHCDRQINFNVAAKMGTPEASDALNQVIDDAVNPVGRNPHASRQFLVILHALDDDE